MAEPDGIKSQREEGNQKIIAAEKAKALAAYSEARKQKNCGKKRKSNTVDGVSMLDERTLTSAGHTKAVCLIWRRHIWVRPEKPSRKRPWWAEVRG